MPIEDSGGLGVPQNREPSESQRVEQIRRNNLEAMAVGIGAHPLTARFSTEALLRNSKVLANIDYTKDKNEQDPKTTDQIEAIGKWFLSGSSQANQLKFPVGCTALSLLKEDPDSGYFKHLKDRVDYWTDGTGGKKFAEVLSKKEE